MSRIGILPIQIPEGVNVDIKDQLVTVKGKLGELKQEIEDKIKVKIEDNNIILDRENDTKEVKSKHGLYRALVSNMVQGVTKGFEKKLELVGVGYKAVANGQVLELGVGYSHPIFIQMPDEVKVEAKTERRSNPIVTISSCDKQLLGQVVAKIRSLRKPEPYKGKGIKFVGEELRRKAGKAAAAEM